MNKKKLALLQSVVSLLLCASMLVGTTFAWFTDTVQTGINTIASGVLDVALYHSTPKVTDEPVNETTKLFLDINGGEILWEPGAVSYENLTVRNEGDLALAYQLSAQYANENHIIDGELKYGLADILKVGIVEGGITATDRAGVVASVEETNWTSLSAFLRGGSLLTNGEEEKWGVVIYWEPGENDNLWNLNNGKKLDQGEFLSIDLGIKLVATQEVYESDSFGDDYDTEAEGCFVETQEELIAVLQMGETAVLLAPGEFQLPNPTEISDDFSYSDLQITGMTGTKITSVYNKSNVYTNVTIENVSFTTGIEKATFVGSSKLKSCTFDLASGNAMKSCKVKADSILVIEDCTFNLPDMNSAIHFSGNDNGTVMLSGCTVNQGYLAFGKGMNVDLWNCDFNNYVAVSCYGDVTLTNCSFTPDCEVYVHKSCKTDAVITLNHCSVDGGLPVSSICYDKGATTDWEFVINDSATTQDPVFITETATLAEGEDSVNFNLSSEAGAVASLSIPADAIADPTMPVTVTFFSIDPADTIALEDNMQAYAYEIDVTNLKSDLTGDALVRVVLSVPNALAAANVYHNGELIEQYTYDEVNGTISFATASFSPYAVSYTEYEVSTIEELRAYASENDVNIKLTADLTVNLDPNADENDCDSEHFCKLTGSYEYYNGVNINGTNISVDLNGHSITVSGDKAGDSVGAMFFIMPNSNLNISDSVGGGMIKLQDPAYLVWAPYDAEYGLSYVDVYSGIFASHSYAGDTRTPGYFAMFYAGEGGKIDIRGGYYLYDNESYTDKNGVVYENVNNGAFNVMNSATTECITIHDGAMLINQHYRQDGYNSNNKEADHDSIKLANGCSLVEVSESVTVDGGTYNTWYQVQTAAPEFEVVFENTESYLYRVGNQNTVALGSLFKTNSTVKSGTEINVSISGNASGTYTANTASWDKGTIRFSGTGVASITIGSCTLNVEVVDAVNATTATSATENNVVLLNDCGFSSLEVSGGYALYGNGFTMTCSTDSYAIDLGYAFVTLEDGTLDNVQIVCPNFDYAALYKSNLTSSDNRSYTDTSGTVRYYNARSGVMVSGNSQILNSRISGARAAVNVSGGNCVIDNSRIELGAVASVLVGAANSVTLRDVTLVQKPTASTYDSSKSLMGFSVLVMATSGGDAAPITLEGTLTQNAWVDENDKQYVPEDAQTIIDTVMGEEEYLHDINGDGTNESLNLGIAYMPADGENTVNTPSITDDRTNKDTVPYDSVEVKYSLMTTYVYSYKNTKGTDDSIKTEDTYAPDTQSDIVTVTYSDTSEGLTTGKSYGTDGWVYELNVDLDTLSGYELDFSKLSMSVNGVTVTDFKVNGSDKPTDLVAVTAGGTTYTLTATVNETEYTATFKVTGTETSKESPSLVASDYEAGLCVASSYGGTWHGAAPVLEGVQIKYWSVAEQQYKTITLSDYTPTTAGQQNGTNSYWTYTPDNGDFTLTIKNETPVHSSNSVYAMPVVCDSKLYFVASSSNGLVNSGNSARTIAITYYFDDNNNGEQLKFSNTWSVEENKDDQYKYSDFCSGTKTKLENCVTPDTLITMADGSQVRVDSLTGTEELLVWNLETGKYDTAPIVFVDSETESEYEIIHLYFSDDSDVKVIYEHGFFDLDLGEYVYIDATNYADYIGHRFVAAGDTDSNHWNVVTLDKVVLETEVTTAWSPVTSEHLCYYTNGVLSMPGGIEGLFNIFEVDTTSMRYDAEKMQKDIETYGLFTLEDFGGMITEEAFEAFNGAYLKVAIGKGLLTWEDIAYMAERYIPLMK